MKILSYKIPVNAGLRRQVKLVLIAISLGPIRESAWYAISTVARLSLDYRYRYR